MNDYTASLHFVKKAFQFMRISVISYLRARVCVCAFERVFLPTLLMTESINSQ